MLVIERISTNFISRRKKGTYYSRSNETVNQIAYVEFVAVDTRSFKPICGMSFKNLAQKIFDAGKHLPISRDVKVPRLLPRVQQR